MTAWILLAAFLQSPAAEQSPAPSNAHADSLKIDLLIKQPEQKCEAQNANEIVVCAQKTDNESQRLRPIANAHIYDKDESKAEFGISENVRMAAEVDSAELGGGVVSKRIMARVKIKF
jgi:hypothetical protein